jgi:hypothetical protein
MSHSMTYILPARDVIPDAEAGDMVIRSNDPLSSGRRTFYIRSPLESDMRGTSLVMDGSPLSARALGLADRFRYWRGASGRRYLFSAIGADALDDLVNVVVLTTVDGPEGNDRVAWVGEIDENGDRSGRVIADAAGRARTFVHFLASTGPERQAILRDLTEAA